MGDLTPDFLLPYNCRMGKLFKHRRSHSLIVCIAILLNLLAPAIGHAMSALTRDPLALEICSATPAKQAPGDSAPHALKHCVFCATHADTYAPPPAPAGLVAVLRGHDAYPAPRYFSPALPFVWSDAQPRGPPAHS